MRKEHRPFTFHAVLLSVLLLPAVPLPAAPQDWSELVKKELFKQPRTLRGSAFLDKPIVGATVSLYDLKGSLLHAEPNATAADGSFQLRCPVPESFRIVVAGGTLGGEPLPDELVRVVPNFVERDVHKTNAVTTLLARYQDRHPELTYGDVTNAVARFLSVPEPVDITEVIDSSEWFSFYFSHSFFMQAARAVGGVSAYLEQLLNEMDEGQNRSFRADGPVGSSLFQNLLKSLVEGAASEVGGAGAGWILGLLNLGPEAQTDARLQDMQENLNEIISDLKNVLSALDDLSFHLALDTNKVQQYIEGMGAKDAISSIKTHHDQQANGLAYFASLRSKDVNADVRKAMQTFVTNVDGPWDIQDQVTRIHDAVISEIGGTEGLLDLWTDELILRTPAGDAPLLDYYRTLEGYFTALLFYQFKGANLVVEAKNSSGQTQGGGDSAATRYLKETFQPMIKEETDVFRRCALRLVLHRCDLFSGDKFLPSAAQDVLARTEFFIAQTLNEDHYGLRAGVLGTANLFPTTTRGAAIDMHFHTYDGGPGVRLDFDVPDKAYDFWGTWNNLDLATVRKGTLYSFRKYDFTAPALGGTFATGDYVVGDGSHATCVATVKRYTKDYVVNPTGGDIVYGYCLAPLRQDGTRAIMDSSVFQMAPFTPQVVGDVSYGEQHSLINGVLNLRTWGSYVYRTSQSASGYFQGVLEYGRDLAFDGSETTTAYLNIGLAAKGSVYQQDYKAGSLSTIGVNVGVVDVSQQKILAMYGPSKTAFSPDAQTSWDETLGQQLSFQVSPGKSYRVFANVSAYGTDPYYDWNFDIAMALSRLSLSFVTSER